MWHGFCCTFLGEYNSERISKIGQYLSKLWTNVLRRSFFWLTVYNHCNTRWFTYLQCAAVMTQSGVTTVHPHTCCLCTRILHCHGHECGFASRPPMIRFAIGRIPHGNRDDFAPVIKPVADLGMFSMFGRTEPPQEMSPHKRTGKFLQHSNMPEIIEIIRRKHLLCAYNIVMRVLKNDDNDNNTVRFWFWKWNNFYKSVNIWWS